MNARGILHIPVKMEKVNLKNTDFLCQTAISGENCFSHVSVGHAEKTYLFKKVFA